MVKTLKDEIVEVLRGAESTCFALLNDAIANNGGEYAKKYWTDKREFYAAMSAKVESARCENCEEYNKINSFCDRWHHQVCEVTPCMCFIQKEK